MLYQRVQRQAAELNQLAAVQTDFLRGVTHDLQTPLTSIGTMALEVSNDDTLTPESRHDLDAITHQVERLRRMVGQLLIASRLEAGVVQPVTEVFAAQPIIERTWAALRADRPFTVAAAGLPHLVVADPDRFEQVLWAVLDNAVKYSPAGSPIHVSTLPRDGELMIDIADVGAGMDAETLSKAFDQFYRSPRARSIAPNGSGIGLFAARGLMRAMGGDIELTSALGHGTTVRLLLPAERADAAE
jgi:signal transduction histidine kinase